MKIAVQTPNSNSCMKSAVNMEYRFTPIRLNSSGNALYNDPEGEGEVKNSRCVPW